MKINKYSAILMAIFIVIPFMGFNSVSNADKKTDKQADKKDAPAIYASPNKKSYSPGESGVLTLTFKTGSKLKIPKDPEVTVSLTSDDVEGQGLQDYSGSDGDYITNSKVKYNFTVPGGAVSGSTLTISGNVKFGYCSSVDGVCKLGNQTFSAKIKVK